MAICEIPLLFSLFLICEKTAQKKSKGIL